MKHVFLKRRGKHRWIWLTAGKDNWLFMHTLWVTVSTMTKKKSSKICFWHLEITSHSLSHQESVFRFLNKVVVCLSDEHNLEIGVVWGWFGGFMISFCLSWCCANLSALCHGPWRLLKFQPLVFTEANRKEEGEKKGAKGARQLSLKKAFRKSSCSIPVSISSGRS